MAVYGTSGYLTAVGALMTKFDVTLVWCSVVAALVTFWYFVANMEVGPSRSGSRWSNGFDEKQAKKAR